ncbi:MAG: aminodeoxychorismate synthase component I [Nitrospirae bacterium]|nr:MAG: aminodeoxychorismate synthase component I [Nitrospirota bacterium]
MFRTARESFLKASPPIPLATVLALPACSTFELYQRLAGDTRCPVLLESGQAPGGPPPGQRYSFIGADPAFLFRCTGSRVGWCARGEDWIDRAGDPLAALRGLLTRMAVPRPPGFPPFYGGVVGYFSYDVARWFERLPFPPPDTMGLPDLELAFFDLVAVADHHRQELWLIFCPFGERFIKESREDLYEEGQARLTALETRLTGMPPVLPDTSPHGPPHVTPGMSDHEYTDRVRRCLDYIAAGDIYQANLSHRFAVDVGGRSPRSIYRRLREINPAPFAALLDLPDVTLVSCSPERLVRVSGTEVETRPIAGTRPRGASADEDRLLIEDLLMSPKERAEHIMLVDLERNDLGRVCVYGSVRVDEFMVVERYSHVSHIVTNIRGRLAPGKDALDVLRAVFPGGTVTGVPKVRCMEIIDELEPVRRGPYTGSIGYLSPSGDLDLNIIIRTLVIAGGRADLQVGAGIVADSDPAREYQETLYKAEALLKALRES